MDVSTASLTYGDPPSAATSHIGDTSPGTPTWAYDTIMIGQSELSEAIVDKLHGWAMWLAHRLNGVENSQYRIRPPVVDQEDYPNRYVHDPIAWAAWSEKVRDKEAKFVNRGQAAPPEKDVVTVFRDDFRRDSVYRHDSGPSTDYIWFGHGWNTSVGVSAQMMGPDQLPDLYIHDSVNKTLTLSLQYFEGWRSAAIYTVNNTGQGRSWARGIFEIRCKFPTYAQVPGGLIPAFWGYCTEALFWRTAERIEIDFFEPHGKNDGYMNGGTVHVHAGQFPGKFGNISEDVKRVKIWGGEMNLETIGTDFHYWDGEFHTYTFRVDDDLSYMSIDGRELFRVPTCAELRQRIYLIANLSVRTPDGEPDRSVRHDMIIDYIEVRQDRRIVESFAPPFAARPVLAGNPKVGQALVVTPNLAGVKDIGFDWYRGGYPIAGDFKDTYRLTKDDIGSSIRCLVRAVGARDQPEACASARERGDGHRLMAADTEPPGDPGGSRVNLGIEAPPATAITDEAIAPSLVRTSAVVAVGTALSRLTGFVRLFATAYALGFARLTDAYTLANTRPEHRLRAAPRRHPLRHAGARSSSHHVESDDDEGTSAVVSVVGGPPRRASPWSACWRPPLDRAPATRSASDRRRRRPTSARWPPRCCGCSCPRCSSTA